MGEIRVLRDKAIRAAMEGVRRQYLAGELALPQKLEHIRSGAVEIGLTEYADYAAEPPHRHARATEYQYMLDGRTQYMDVETEQVYEFVRGDFFVIAPGTAYAQRAKPGTRILFVKSPAGNDKQPLPADEAVRAWMGEKLRTVRTDYYHAPDAPRANSIRPAAAVAIARGDALLMLLRRDNGMWTMPGGTMEPGESLEDCAMREVREETGLRTAVTGVIGVYTDPQILVAYSDGEVRQEFTVVYAGSADDGAVALDDESTRFRWVPFQQLDGLEMARSQRCRVQDAVRYFCERKTRWE